MNCGRGAGRHGDEHERPSAGQISDDRRIAAISVMIAGIIATIRSLRMVNQGSAIGSVVDVSEARPDSTTAIGCLETIRSVLQFFSKVSGQAILRH